MSTEYSKRLTATAAQPYILTHKRTRERYRYSESHLNRTRALYKRYHMRLEDTYTVTREHP